MPTQIGGIDFESSSGNRIRLSGDRLNWNNV